MARGMCRRAGAEWILENATMSEGLTVGTDPELQAPVTEAAAMGLRPDGPGGADDRGAPATGVVASADAEARRPARRVLAVWSRALDDVESVGRVNVARSVRDALASLGTLSEVRLRTAFEGLSPGGVAAAIWALAAGVLRGRPLPLQCAIFAAGRGAREALRAADGSDVVYADGIRTLLWLRRLRRRRPDVEIVLDLDDLMSRRYGEVLERRLPLSLGYLERMMPCALARLVTAPAVARLVLGYERVALRHAEREALRLADRVVLLNAHEASLLGASAAATVQGPCATVLAIPPPTRPVRQAGPALRPPWRAVFIGTDTLVQNRLTIDYLLDLWARERIALPLVLYGRHKRPPRAVPGVTWAGYARDIAEVYAPGSILVSPAFLRGGIKTKVLEGFAHKVPVVGNSASFEGLALHGYPLCFDREPDLLTFLSDPSRHLAVMAGAVETAERYLEREHSPELFRQRWLTAVGAAPARPAVEAGVPVGHRT
jgi:hypothetical protein